MKWLRLILISCFFVNTSIAVNKPSWITANTNEIEAIEESQKKDPQNTNSNLVTDSKANDNANSATRPNWITANTNEIEAIEESQKKDPQNTNSNLVTDSKVNDNANSATRPSWVTANTNEIEVIEESQNTQNTNSNFDQTNFNSSDYVIPNNINIPNNISIDENGIRELPPLTPPVNNYQQAKSMVSPLSPEDTKKLRQYYDNSRAAKYYQPTKTIPKISSTTVDLSAGAALPILRTMPNETSTLVFIDSTGAPWPLAAIPRVSNPNAFDVEWLADSPSVIVSAKNSYESGNLTVFLHGLAIPVIVKLVTNEEPRNKSKEVDYRLDLRVPGRGPNAKESIIGDNKIGLYDDIIQSFLDGLPPEDSIKIKFSGNSSVPVQIWKYKNSLYVRTSLNIQNAFDQIISSGDGTKVYKIMETPFITFSDDDKKIVLQLEI